MAGADPDVTARLAKSLLGHPGRKARFLQGPLQDWFGDRNLKLFQLGIDLLSWFISPISMVYGTCSHSEWGL